MRMGYFERNDLHAFGVKRLIFTCNLRVIKQWWVALEFSISAALVKVDCLASACLALCNARLKNSDIRHKNCFHETVYAKSI